MTTSLVGLLLVSLMGMVGVFLLWPQRLKLCYRKTWMSQLGWIGYWHLPAGQRLQLNHRGWWWRWGSLHWRRRWPTGVGNTLLPSDWLRYWPYLLDMGKQIHLTSWQGGIEIGFADPAVTGQCLGLIAALPPQLAQHIHLTFTRIGWCGQGSLHIRFRGWRMLGPGLKLGWQLWQAKHQLGKRKRL
ncbi:MAG: hypothetical protein ACUVRV_10815 [Cyanobacteriota bacterium]